MAQGHRPDRVGDQIRQELSDLLTRGTVHDPGIGFITLTRVKVSPDLQQARVYYTSMGDPQARRETEKALQRATPFFRRQVGGRLQLRRVPELEFRFDESVGHQDRIEQILRDLHEEEAQRTAPDSGPGMPDPVGGVPGQGPPHGDSGSEAQDPPHRDGRPSDDHGD